MQTTNPTQPVRPADLEHLLDRIAAAARRYEDTDPPCDELDEAAANLIDRYRALVDALQPRPVDSDGGQTIGITVAGLDIHVRDDGHQMAVSVNADDAPEQTRVVIESWDQVSWERELN